MTKDTKSQQNKHHRLIQREKVKQLEKEIKRQKSMINILIKALNKQGIEPQFACSCFGACTCLEKSLKLI